MNVYLKKSRFLRGSSTSSGQDYRWQKVAITAIGVILLIILLNIFQAPLKNGFYYATQPLQKMFWGAGESVNSFFTPWINGRGLVQENKNLKEENQKLLAQVFSLQDDLEKNQAIQSVVKNTQSDNFKMVLAQAIGLKDDAMLINRGAEDGILENMPVVSEQKVVYGKVAKVYKNFSEVMLISNKDSVVDAKVQSFDTTQAPISGAVKGSANGSMYLDLVSLEANLQQNDMLITSGLEGIFPKDLLIGKVTSIDKNDVKPFQTAKVQPLLDIQNAENLFIITNYKR